MMEKHIAKIYTLDGELIWAGYVESMEFTGDPRREPLRVTVKASEKCDEYNKRRRSEEAHQTPMKGTK